MSEIARNVIISVIATLTLAAIYFFGEKLFYPTPDISGKWQFVTNVKETSYSPFIGMKLTYDVYLKQNELQLEGTGEKVKENVKGVEKEYIGSERIQIDIDGRIEKRLFGKPIVHIQYTMSGQQRQSTARQKLTHNGEILSGSFSSTVAEESGTVVWTRK